MLSVLPPVTVYEPEYVPKAPVIDASAPLDIHQEDDGTWIVESTWLRQVMSNVNFADYESRMWFDKVLRTTASSRSWRKRASRTGTPCPCTTSSSNISDKAPGGRSNGPPPLWHMLRRKIQEIPSTL